MYLAFVIQVFNVIAKSFTCCTKVSAQAQLGTRISWPLDNRIITVIPSADKLIDSIRQPSPPVFPPLPPVFAPSFPDTRTHVWPPSTDRYHAVFTIVAPVLSCKTALSIKSAPIFRAGSVTEAFIAVTSPLITQYPSALISTVGVEPDAFIFVTTPSITQYPSALIVGVIPSFPFIRSGFPAASVNFSPFKVQYHSSFSCTTLMTGVSPSFPLYTRKEVLSVKTISQPDAPVSASSKGRVSLIIEPLIKVCNNSTVLLICSHRSCNSKIIASNFVCSEYKRSISSL